MTVAMREAANITSVGLNNEDTRVLNSILKIVINIHNGLNQLEPEALPDADIVFFDANDKTSFARIKKNGDNITPIAIVKGNATLSNMVSIKRPIVLKRVLQAIETVSSTRVANNPPDDSNGQQGYSIHTQQVLVVDDSFPVRKYMEQKLQELSSGDVHLSFAGNGVEAVSQIKTTNFNAIFLDVVMPDINGYKICKWIKSVQPNCKVIMLSGKKSAIDKVRGSMSGCDAYLTKPPSDQRLTEIYHSFISRYIEKKETA